mmetsp:Transcript_17637/g.37761  ORF Transcript_17637/g.37761 Transcript_17637/m.37761 type:complete len:404 (-) Transcript_17637:245-1456(-)
MPPRRVASLVVALSFTVFLTASVPALARCESSFGDDDNCEISDDSSLIQRLITSREQNAADEDISNKALPSWDDLSGMLDSVKGEAVVSGVDALAEMLKTQLTKIQVQVHEYAQNMAQNKDALRQGFASCLARAFHLNTTNLTLGRGQLIAEALTNVGFVEQTWDRVDDGVKSVVAAIDTSAAPILPPEMKNRVDEIMASAVGVCDAVKMKLSVLGNVLRQQADVSQRYEEEVQTALQQLEHASQSVPRAGVSLEEEFRMPSNFYKLRLLKLPGGEDPAETCRNITYTLRDLSGDVQTFSDYFDSMFLQLQTEVTEVLQGQVDSDVLARVVESLQKVKDTTESITTQALEGSTAFFSGLQGGVDEAAAAAGVPSGAFSSRQPTLLVAGLLLLAVSSLSSLFAA